MLGKSRFDFLLPPFTAHTQTRTHTHTHTHTRTDRDSYTRALVHTQTMTDQEVFRVEALHHRPLVQRVRVERLELGQQGCRETRGCRLADHGVLPLAASPEPTGQWLLLVRLWVGGREEGEREREREREKEERRREKRRERRRTGYSES